MTAPTLQRQNATSSLFPSSKGSNLGFGNQNTVGSSLFQRPANTPTFGHQQPISGGFGQQTSAFGQQSLGGSAFGRSTSLMQPTQSNPTSIFNTQQTAVPGASTSIFGQSSALTAPAQNASLFSTSQVTPSPFGASGFTSQTPSLFSTGGLAGAPLLQQQQQQQIQSPFSLGAGGLAQTGGTSIFAHSQTAQPLGGSAAGVLGGLGSQPSLFSQPLSYHQPQPQLHPNQLQPNLHSHTTLPTTHSPDYSITGTKMTTNQLQITNTINNFIKILNPVSEDYQFRFILYNRIEENQLPLIKQFQQYQPIQLIKNPNQPSSALHHSQQLHQQISVPVSERAWRRALEINPFPNLLFPSQINSYDELLQRVNQIKRTKDMLSTLLFEKQASLKQANASYDNHIALLINARRNQFMSLTEKFITAYAIIEKIANQNKLVNVNSAAQLSLNNKFSALQDAIKAPSIYLIFWFFLVIF
jgi:hypothetical protein